MGFVRRRTRRRTMMVAGGAAYAMGKHRANAQAAQEDQQYQEEPQYEEAPPAPPPPAPSLGSSDLDELKGLAELHTSGALTDEEFASAKAKILGS